MRDVVVTEQREEHAHAVPSRRAPRPSPVPLSFHASLGARHETKKNPRQPATWEPFSVREPRFFPTRSTDPPPTARVFAKSEYRRVFAVKRAAEKRDFVDSARRCRSTRGRFFFVGEIHETPSQSWRATRVFPSHPRIPARDSSHERSFPVKRGVGCARRHSRTARVQALRSASRRVSPEFSSLRARAQRARVVRTETDARARVSFRIHGVAHQRVFFRIPRSSAALRHG